MAIAKMWNGTSWVDVAGSPSDMMTLDTTQTITGAKDFTTVPTVNSRAVPGVAGLASPMIQSGSISVTYSAQSAVSGTAPNFSPAFSAAPILVASIYVGSNLDILVNVSSLSATGWLYRTFNRALGSVTGTAFIHWIAIGLP